MVQLHGPWCKSALSCVDDMEVVDIYGSKLLVGTDQCWIGM